MAELYGKDQVAAFIDKSGKKKWRIKVGKSVRGESDQDLVNDFNSWADMFDTNGMNTQCYTIVCFDVDVEEEGTIKRANRQTIESTFCLNMPVPRTINGPQQQNGILTKEDLISAIKGITPQAAPVDYTAIITAAVEKVEHKSQLKELTSGFQGVVQNLTMQLSDLRDEMADMMEEEEESEMAKATIGAAKIQADADLEKYRILEKVAPQALQKIGDLVVHFFPGLGGTNTPLRAAAAVNGPRINTSNNTGWQIPVSDKVGERKPYPSEAEVDKDPNTHLEDQKAKAVYVVTEMVQTINDCAADDLMLLLKLSKDDPNQYSDLIQKLRNMMGAKVN